MRAFKASACLGIGAVVLLTVTASEARVTWDLHPPGTTGQYDWTFTQHWLYNEFGAVGDYVCTQASQNCAFHSLGTGTAATRINTQWGGGIYGQDAPECLELTTHPAPGSQYPNPDTVIEAQDANGAWHMVNDDVASGTYQSHARIWIASNGATMEFGLRIRPYSQYSNGQDFNMTITRRDVGIGTSGMAACTTNSGFPWVQFTNQKTVTIHSIQTG